MSAKPPMTSAEVEPDWTAMVADLIRREGRSMRAHPHLPMIEIKTLLSNKWMPLMLPNSGVSFASFEDRNSVMKAIHIKAQ